MIYDLTRMSPPISLPLKNPGRNLLSLNEIDPYGKNRLTNDGSAKKPNDKLIKLGQENVWVKKPGEILKLRLERENGEKMQRRKSGNRKKLSSGRGNCVSKRGSKGGNAGRLDPGLHNERWNVIESSRRLSTISNIHLNFLSL
jgi:hypothetical protein